ncbi:MAG: VTT domain-containing protein, partial [Dehalococcoidia bacterium]|nr:VTT domain-containing protein [Dehalococcoidia bacterium]
EVGLPITSPIFEGLLIFTGFQVVDTGYIAAALPFLAVAMVGRLCGSMVSYRLSSSLGNKVINRIGKHIRVTQERIDLVKQRLGTLAIPSIIVARFTPGFGLISNIASGISRISYRRFLTAVLIHVLAWEAIFLALGALGGKVSKSFNPQLYPTVLVVWIVVMVVVGIAVSYFAFRRIRTSK